MNDQLAELKTRLRKIEELLADGAAASLQDRIGVLQAVSRARRLVRREDRTRAPSAEFRASVEQAEQLAAAARR
jgi:hypothetical protein